MNLAHPHLTPDTQSTREDHPGARTSTRFLESRAPKPVRAFSPNASSRYASSRTFTLIALSLAVGATLPFHAYADDNSKPPLLTALQGTAPGTQISVPVSDGNANVGNTRVESQRVARATPLRAESRGLKPAVVTYASASRLKSATMKNNGRSTPAQGLASKAFARSVSQPTVAKNASALRTIPTVSGDGKTSIIARQPGDGVRVINGSIATETGKVRLARGDDPLASLPAATMQPRAANELEANGLTSLPGLSAASKIIKVEALKLPPVSQPLPQWMQNVTVSADQLLPIANPNAKGGTRVAQNPMAPPLRQPQSPVTSSDRLPNQIEVATSTYVVLVTKADLETVAIADPNIADVTIVNARSVLVNGKAPGATTLVVVDRLGKIRQYQVRVVPAPGTREVDIARIIGIEGVGVRRVQDAIILEGEVASAEEMQRAMDIAGIFATKIVNQLRVRGGAVDPGLLTATQIQEAINRPDVQVRVINKKAILDGVVANDSERMRAEMIAKTFAEEVVNLLRLPSLTADQVRDMLGGVAAADVLSPISGIAGELRLPQRLVVRQVGDLIILEGVLPTQADIDAALASASRTGLQVVNRLSVAPAPPAEAALLQTIAQSIGIPGVRVRGSSKRIVLEGTVADTNTALRAGQIARGFASDVDNMLAVTNPTQINVDVSIVEISRTDFKNLGVSFPGLTDSSVDFSGGVNLGGIGIGEGNGDTTLGTTFTTTLRAQIDKGNIRLLSNPRTTVLSGRTASFQAGGQIPVPSDAQVTGTGITTVSVEFKDFGVLMDVTPVGTNDGVVTMRVRTDITQLDPETGSITVAPGISVPSFTRRAAVTEVTTRSGGTIALSGLISDNVRKAVREVPFLSKIPIIGSLFKSKRFLRGETDLVIFVTPRVLENVLPPGGTAPASVVAEGPSAIVPVPLGNPGITTFGTIGGSGVQPAGGAGGGS